jgi:hypothetical protein
MVMGSEVHGDGGTGDEEPEDCETEEDPSTHRGAAIVPAAEAGTVRARLEAVLKLARKCLAWGFSLPPRLRDL